jgi:hypothetical protein
MGLSLPAVGADKPIAVEVWPDDVPCGILQKNPDGSIETTAPILRFFAVHNHMKFRNTRETAYWDRKCGFARQAGSAGILVTQRNRLAGFPAWIVYGAAAWLCAIAAVAVWLWRGRKGR